MQRPQTVLLLLSVSAASAATCGAAGTCALSAHSYEETKSWCASAVNHKVVVTVLERHTGQLSPSTLYRALSCVRRCGFVKLAAVVDVAVLAAVRRSMRQLLEREPRTPLLNTLRQDEAGSNQAHELQPAGRYEVGLPFGAPYNTSSLTNITLLSQLARSMLDSATLGIELDIAAFLSVGASEAQQQWHNDVEYASRILRGRSLVEPPVEVQELLELMAAALSSGNATYALNIQMPLVKVTQVNAPTNLCAGSHSDQFCDQHLGSLCSEDGNDQTDSDPLGEFVAQHCVPVLGTADVGDALVYDSRLIHWGGANHGQHKRDVLSFSFAHAWWSDTNRPLSKEGAKEMSRWRKHWRRVAPRATGAINLKELRRIFTQNYRIMNEH